MDQNIKSVSNKANGTNGTNHFGELSSEKNDTNGQKQEIKTLHKKLFFSKDRKIKLIKEEQIFDNEIIRKREKISDSQ